LTQLTAETGIATVTRASGKTHTVLGSLVVKVVISEARGSAQGGEAGQVVAARCNSVCRLL